MSAEIPINSRLLVHSSHDQNYSNRAANPMLRSNDAMRMAAAADHVGDGPRRAAVETDFPAGITYHQGPVLVRPNKNGTYWMLVGVLIEGQPFANFVTFNLVDDCWPM